MVRRRRAARFWIAGDRVPIGSRGNNRSILAWLEPAQMSNPRPPLVSSSRPAADGLNSVNWPTTMPGRGAAGSAAGLGPGKGSGRSGWAMGAGGGADGSPAGSSSAGGSAPGMSGIGAWAAAGSATNPATAPAARRRKTADQRGANKCPAALSAIPGIVRSEGPVRSAAEAPECPMLRETSLRHPQLPPG